MGQHLQLASCPSGGCQGACTGHQAGGRCPYDSLDRTGPGVCSGLSEPAAQRPVPQGLYACIGSKVPVRRQREQSLARHRLLMVDLPVRPSARPPPKGKFRGTAVSRPASRPKSGIGARRPLASAS
ncbi:hypothetical protein RA210_U10422 [Rubrivivax sp. A210]|nr:hypothetical protein RA210_U10422 [Rubrivivax sp. A210]